MSATTPPEIRDRNNDGRPVFRFAPSPNGLLHLGHARSALTNQRMADAAGGRMLLRMEDIDTARCTPALEEQMLVDLHWLGLEWEQPVRRQSEHFFDYASALDVLVDAGLAYPSFMSRGDIRRAMADRADWPNDPDGAPVYPGTERDWSETEKQQALADNRGAIWRLDMAAALHHVGSDIDWLEIDETGVAEPRKANPMAWGDVVLARVDTPTSYHLSVVVDDAIQNVTHIVRGMDLAPSTAVHRVLQELLGLPMPVYHHHPLVLGDDGRKLSKSAGDTSLKALREAGLTCVDIERMAGL